MTWFRSTKTSDLLVVLDTRDYVCPECHQVYQRIDLGRQHPEYETLLCFICVKTHKRPSANQGS